ncbi:ABC transporter permease subunit [Natronorubrum sp. JWXQ-INN-674]|uniref:ABC transporter permease subunit n=1 Tax=Natronorubrum halalkaliphilum TaxID=2691917 RepID=A0A6B0VGD6_9EURY|nr:ABC transporter permease [Natronorubrum halalkaliphilum]MXV60554.1 ABC transporter permease subunit [Natronorubrum halalkaliphilum]
MTDTNESNDTPRDPDEELHDPRTGDEGRFEDQPLRERIAANPRPAAIWVAGLTLLVALQFGAIANFVVNTIPWSLLFGILPSIPGAGSVSAAGQWFADLPALLTRETIPNEGYYVPGEGWQGTFLGLSPAIAWAIRVVLVYAYSFAFLAWVWYAYVLFRRHYRYADWTPRDDIVGRLRTHRWGQFGIVVVLAFLVLALFAPALATAPVEQNIEDPYSHTIEYYDAELGEVTETTVGDANRDSASRGSSSNVGPMTYDEYDRFHPIGTLPSGGDLFTFMAFGARISLLIGLLSLAISGIAAATLALFGAYYKGKLDLSFVVASDSVQAMPRLLLLVLLSVVLADTWLGGLYSGAIVLALIFGATGWPALWRAVRGPALQVSEKEWIDAARSYGQAPTVTMRRHMLPYILGYLLIYASMTLGGIIVGVAGLSFLGLGVDSPTPEWGRAIDAGQDYVTTSSWHISLIPGIFIVLVVTAFNALGDGIRDAIDPQSDVGGDSDDATDEAAAGGTGA